LDVIWREMGNNVQKLCIASGFWPEAN